MCVVRKMRLATKTALIFSAFALFCVGVTTALLLRESRAHMAEAVSERQALFADAQAVALRERLDLVGDALGRLSRIVGQSGTAESASAQSARLSEAFRQSTVLRGGVQLFDERGDCQWAEPSTIPCRGLSYHNASWLRTAANANVTTMIGDVDNTGHASVMMLVPTRLNTSEHAGVLRALLNVSDTDLVFGPLVRRSAQMQGELGVVAPAGVLLFASQHMDAQQLAFRQAVNAVHRGETGTATDGSGHAHRLFVWAPVRSAGLGLVYAWNWDRIDPGSQQELLELTYISAVVLIAALLLGYVMSRFVARPIRELASEVRQMSQGHQTNAGPLKGDEIGALQQAFDDLTSSLKERDARIKLDMAQITELAESLERRVEERTQELQKAQAALVETERLAVIGQAGAIISHELRNSLNAVGMGIDLLIRNTDGRQELRAVQQQIRSEVSRLRSLSDDLLNFTKEPTLRRRPVQLHLLVQTAAALVQDHAEASNVEIVLNVPETTRVDVDSDRIQSVIVNALRNGVEAASASERTPRRVEVSVEDSRDGRIHIRIDDTGDGVRADLGERAFEPFVTTKRTGTGLGLATAARFVRAHGGSIHLSAGPLLGARLEFDVALAQITPELRVN